MIDIGTKSSNPIGKKLSSFNNWGFIFDGIECKSIESVLQSFKFKDAEEQIKICGLLGYQAKYNGMKSNQWKETQTLYWIGKEYPRRSREYHELLLNLFRECFEQNNEARGLLLATGDEPLSHSIGKSDPSDTILTDKELIVLLVLLRKEFRERNMEKHYTFKEIQQIAEDMQSKYPDINLYLVEGHYQGREWTIRFMISKKVLQTGECWYNTEYKDKRKTRKRWKSDKFGKIAFPDDKKKAKELSDILYKEW
jgi:hypothetical protein